MLRLHLPWHLEGGRGRAPPHSAYTSIQEANDVSEALFRRLSIVHEGHK